MNVSITPELKTFIDSQVATGGYNNASEVVREAVRRLQAYTAWKAYVHAAIEEGVADVQAGRVVDGPTSMAEGRAKLEALIIARARQATPA